MWRDLATAGKRGAYPHTHTHPHPHTHGYSHADAYADEHADLDRDGHSHSDAALANGHTNRHQSAWWPVHFVPATDAQAPAAAINISPFLQPINARPAVFIHGGLCWLLDPSTTVHWAVQTVSISRGDATDCKTKGL